LAGEIVARENADVLRTSRTRLYAFLADFPEMRDALEQGRGEGRVSLRRKQWLMAEKNPAMAIWLGKQYLGQKEQSATEITQKRDVVEMSDAELIERLRALDAAIAASGGDAGSSKAAGRAGEPDRVH
jgi:hypothetical protein